MQVLNLFGQAVALARLHEIGAEVAAWRQQIEGVEALRRAWGQAHHCATQRFGELLVLQVGIDHKALVATLPVEQQIALDEQFAEIALAGAGHPADEEVRVLQRAIPGIEQHRLVRLAHAHQHATRHHERVGQEREHGGERGRIQRERAQQFVAGLWQAGLQDLNLLKGGRVRRRVQREQAKHGVEAF